jgi:hypothetical protein
MAFTCIKFKEKLRIKYAENDNRINQSTSTSIEKISIYERLVSSWNTFVKHMKSTKTQHTFINSTNTIQNRVNGKLFKKTVTEALDKKQHDYESLKGNSRNDLDHTYCSLKFFHHNNNNKRNFNRNVVKNHNKKCIPSHMISDNYDQVYFNVQKNHNYLILSDFSGEIKNVKKNELIGIQNRRRSSYYNQDTPL